jgi:hypothetical protein
MNMLHSPRLGWSLFFVAMTACSSQVTPDYAGEPLALIEGTIVDSPVPTYRLDSLGSVPSAESLPSDALVAIEWQGERNFWTGVGTVTAGASPRFTLQFFGAPPAGATVIDDRGELAEAFGYVTILAPGTSLSPNPGSLSNIWGYSRDTAIVYFARDARPFVDGERDIVREDAETFQIPATRGYHMVRMILGDRRERDLCRWQGRHCGVPACPNGTNWESVMWSADALLCREAFPDAPICNSCTGFLSGEPPCPDEPRNTCPGAATYEPNPEDRPLAVTVTLGLTNRDITF